MINLDDTRHLQEIVLQLSAANDLLNRIAVSLEAIAAVAECYKIEFKDEQQTEYDRYPGSKKKFVDGVGWVRYW